MVTSFCNNCFGKIVDNGTSYPGPFRQFLKHRNYCSQFTFSFEGEKKQEVFGLYYDNKSLLHLLVVLIILSFLF